eukprot:1134822_1
MQTIYCQQNEFQIRKCKPCNRYLNPYGSYHLDLHPIVIIIVIIYYNQRASNYWTIFPSLFLSSFYVSEFYVRSMTNDILLHHFLYLALYITAFAQRTTIIFDCFNIIEFGHIFHFIPYLLYKFGCSLNIVYVWNIVGVILFFCVRVIGFVLVICFTAFTNRYVLRSSVFVLTVIVVGVSVLFLLQLWMWRDVIKATKHVGHKKETKNMETHTPKA